MADMNKIKDWKMYRMREGPHWYDKKVRGTGFTVMNIYRYRGSAFVVAVVKDENGERIPDIKVIAAALSQDGSVLGAAQEGMTDTQGECIFKLLKGKYQIELKDPQKKYQAVGPWKKVSASNAMIMQVPCAVETSR